MDIQFLKLNYSQIIFLCAALGVGLYIANKKKKEESLEEHTKVTEIVAQEQEEITKSKKKSKKKPKKGPVNEPEQVEVKESPKKTEKKSKKSKISSSISTPDPQERNIEDSANSIQKIKKTDKKKIKDADKKIKDSPSPNPDSIKTGKKSSRKKKVEEIPQNENTDSQTPQKTNENNTEIDPSSDHEVWVKIQSKAPKNKKASKGLNIKPTKWDSLNPQQSLDKPSKQENNGFSVLRLIPSETPTKKPKPVVNKPKVPETLDKKARENLRKSERIKNAKKIEAMQQEIRLSQHKKELETEKMKEFLKKSSKKSVIPSSSTPSGASLYNGRLVWD
ncbi:hypothetical protein AYI68_g225 [Smittium mucronatum]|uniref:Uncharacterized protein n=1 Tax=Smittium mucronatum TaxID=133383 RepID=A0A1R0H8Y4_9FUNG|nr:hypothetical protein AYI68_g225 [Smittium mucronatum]